MRRAIALAGAVLLLLLAATSASAEGPRLSPVGGAEFPDRTFLLTLPERASLSPERVRLRENADVVQDLRIVPGSKVGQRQFGTVLVIDASRSMHGKAIEGAVEAARTFAEQRNPEQPLGIVVFNEQPVVTLPLTTDGAQIRTALASTPTLARGTNIYDATDAALGMLEQGGIRAGSVIVLSDGADTGSRATLEQVAKEADRTPARIYTVGLRTRAYSSSTLKELAGATGGSYTEATSSDRLREIYRRIGAELSNQYVLQYRSNASLGDEVRVAVRVEGVPGVAQATYRTKPLSEAPAARDEEADFFNSTRGALVISVVAALLLGIGILVALAPNRSVRSRIDRYITVPDQHDEKAWSAALVSRVIGENARQQRTGFWAQLTEDFALAGIRMTPETAVFWVLVATFLLGWLLVAGTGSAAAGVLALLLPVGGLLLVRVRVDRQRALFGEQLPDNLQVIASAMRAGHTFVGAMNVVLDDTQEPSRREFRRILTDEQLGVPLPEAMRRVAERMKSVDFERVALITTLQRETGGNTAEVMDSLTETINERVQVRRTIRTLTAQGRLTRWIVSALPPVLLVVVTLINPDYMNPLYTTTAGILLLVAAAILLVVGSLIIKRIVEIDV